MKQINFMYFNDNATSDGTGISTSFNNNALLAIDTTGANEVTMYFEDQVGDNDAPDKVAITCTNASPSDDQLDYAHRKGAISTMVSLANSVNKGGHVVCFDTLNNINPNSTDIASIAITMNS